MNKPNSAVGGRKRPASLRDVAEKAGVSKATASLVLRGSPLVAAGTRAQVHAAMGALGYIYNRTAANMRRGRSGTIGLLLADIGSPFYAELAAGLNAVLDREGLVSLFASADESPERQTRQIRRLREQGADGVLLCPAIGADPSLLDLLSQLELPCVQTLRVVSPTGADSVTPDYAAAMEAAVAHLVALGRARIAFIGAESLHSAALDRATAFRTAMESRGRSPAVSVGVPTTAAGGAAALDRLLALPEPVDAVICYNDTVAFGVCGRLQALGKIVGRDVAVIGADDLPLAAQSWPPLTTIATGPRIVGEHAARMLLHRLAEPLRPVEAVRLPAPLVVRRSCGSS